MAMSEQQTFERAQATQSVMTTLKNGATPWEWDEMSGADFSASLQAARSAQTIEAQKEAALDQQRGLVNERFGTLEKRKVQALGMAMFRFRKQPDVLEMISGVGEYGSSREDTLKEAGEWAGAWERTAPSWVPAPDNSLDSFKVLMLDCEAQNDILVGRKSDARRAGIDLRAMLGELEDVCVSWYGQATRVFPDGSQEGDLLRSQIPTFDDPPAPQPVTPPAPTS